MKRLLILAGGLLGAVGLGVVIFDRLAPEASAKMALGVERSRCGLVEKIAQVDGFTLPYLEGGTGEPLMLIHGIAADKDHFTRVSKPLVEKYRVIAVDVPGFGGTSRRPEVPYDIPTQVERLRALAQQLKIDKLHLGGSSMGGFIATTWALSHPEEVQSLWLLAPAGVSHAKDSEVFAEYRASGKMRLFAQTPEEFDAVMSVVLEKPPFLPWSLHQLLAARAAADFPLHSKILKEVIASPWLDERLSEVKAPALIVWGEKDRVLDPSGAQLFAQIPGSKVVLMPGLGHLPMAEAPADCAKDYLAFRAQLSAPP